MVTKHLIITGRVQGVGFRNYMAFKARQFRITGWVRNRADGSVEAVVHGSAEDVDAMILRAHRGPPKSAVSSVKASNASGTFADFVTLPTE
jgi:acylphosphatase